MTEDTSATDYPEIHRLQMLQALGITSWYPRYQLPNAAPSQSCAWPQPAADEEAPDTHQANTSASSRQPAHASQPATASSTDAVQRPKVSGQFVPETRTRAPDPAAILDEVPAANAQVTEEDTSLAFQLLLMQVDNELVVCNQMPALSRQGMGRRERVLLDNILHWLGRGTSGGGGQRRFQWPLPGLGGGDIVAAGKSLNGFLEQAQQELGFTILVSMGGTAAECLGALAGEGKRPEAPWHMLSCPSLSEMLVMPTLKKDTWQILSLLRRPPSAASGAE